ncbi:phage tail sheath subtilisin-like domain-containing protein [Komagataeibacter sucrofermentans]|uniref:Phage tail protein n=1 Tax=Komagataeibacter sucrofermentans TaxID=1053551 RepID=A0A318QRB2_9PROT|nr:phage tail sheath subtilisin-like domain-containing protein [Komagataeibacter sucrofermentans]PYD79988.1 phage tail protein [Komagataeibacter sucrofermentans]GBQ52251.1 bacteriophage tail sheath protein [Komagataeibacter sucrofermentans DSM 15973]
MSGSITVPGYPTNNRVPGFYFALDNSRANTASYGRRVLIVAQTTTGAALAGTARLSAGVTDAQGLYGTGSQAAIMVQNYFSVDPLGEVWVLPLADDAASVAARGTVTITGPASASGTLCLYVGDQLIPTLVTAGDTAATIAENVVTAAQAVTGLPVTLAVDATTAGQINVTALNKGLCGNDILLGVNLLGTAGGQSLPTGVAVTLGQMTGGTQNPTTLATALAGLGDRVYDLFLHPYTDTATLDVFKQVFNNTDGRWAPMEQLYGHGITAYRGTYGEATAFGLTQNDPHTTIMAISDSPSSPMVWAAQIGAQVAASIRINPALPVTGVALTVMPPTDAGRFTLPQRNSLLWDGMSTFTVDDSGTVNIERLLTTYQENAEGVPDNSYLDIETLMTAMICLQDMRIFLALMFGGFILVADGTKIPAGAKATTAQLIGKACAARYRWQCTQFWAQNADTFADQLQAQNQGGGQVFLLMPYDFANQLWVIAGNCQFVKS